MARYRLRFQLQEIDLTSGETVIGRSPDCHVTVEDPLVSRRHACIRIDELNGAHVEDLGSRNGVSLNERPIRAPEKIRDGDRIRIGTQEFVFHVVSDTEDRLHGKDTGFLRFCDNCRYPFPEEINTCPNCGYRPESTADESTLSGVVVEHHVDWASQLLLELLERALALGQWEEAMRVVKRVTSAFDERLKNDDGLELTQFDDVLHGVSRVAQAHQDAALVIWVLSRCVTMGHLPSLDVIQRLAGIPVGSGDELCKLLDSLLAAIAGKTVRRESVEALTRWRNSIS